MRKPKLTRGRRVRARNENAAPTPTVAVSHNCVEGTRVRAPRNDLAIAVILLAHGFCWSHRLGHWALPGSCGLAYCHQERDVSAALRAAGVHVLIADASIDTPPEVAQQPLSEGIIALRYEAYATFTAQRCLFERLLAGAARPALPRVPRRRRGPAAGDPERVPPQHGRAMASGGREDHLRLRAIARRRVGAAHLGAGG